MNPEAIEAAAKAMGKLVWCDYDHETDMDRDEHESNARAALEAAAPYLIREARAAELEAAAEDWERAIPETIVSVFATGIRQCAKSLRDRAAAIQDGNQ